MVAGNGGGYNLGQATGRIVIDGSGIDSGIASAKASLTSGLQSMGQSIANFGGQITSLGASLTVLTAPLDLFIKKGIETAASFESSMAEISARTGLTGASLEEVRNLALQMGADTSFSAQQAADAFLQLLSSGQTAEEAIATLPVVLDAAAASGENLGHTADVVTDIMAAFHLSVSDARMVVDAMAQAAGASSADMASLGQGFANIGPMAAEFGLSVSETASILAIFAENGIKGGEAGTQLRSMLRNMTAPTDSVQKTWARLGVSMYDAQGKVRPMSQIMKDLTTALAPLSERDRIDVLSTLGGAYGQMGLAALTAGISMDDMQARMAGQADASDVAAARMDTFNGRIESLKGSVETLMIEALTPFMENVLQPLIEQLIVIVNGVTDWVNANPELASQIMQLLAVVAILGPVLVAAGLAISAIGTIISIIASPVVLIIGLIAALYLAFTTNFLGIRDTLQPIIDQIVLGLGNIWAGIVNVIGQIGLWLQQNPEFVVAMGLIAGAIAAVVIVVNGLGFAVGLLTTALGFLFSPIVLVVGALAALVAVVQERYPGGISKMLSDAATSARQLADIFFINLVPGVRGAQDAIDKAVMSLAQLQVIVGLLKGGQITLPQVLQQIGYEITGGDLAHLPKSSSSGGGSRGFGDTSSSQTRDSGGPGMADMPYLIGKGAQPELFVPNTNGTFIPNADQLGGVHIGSVYITANSAAEGRAAAESFEVRLQELMRSRGG